MATVVELRQKAKELGIKGYSKMNKGDLEKAIKKASKPKQMPFTTRLENYRKQNGSMHLTPKQYRRLVQKGNRGNG